MAFAMQLENGEEQISQYFSIENMANLSQFWIKIRDWASPQRNLLEILKFNHFDFNLNVRDYNHNS